MAIPIYWWTGVAMAQAAKAIGKSIEIPEETYYNVTQSLAKVQEFSNKFEGLDLNSLSDEDVLDLYENTFKPEAIKLAADQEKHYKELVKELYTEINGGKITAANEGVKMGKLLQIACGMVYDKAGISQKVDASPRIAEVKRVVEEAGHKVIVFVPYTAPLQALYDELSKDFECRMVHGGVSKSQRSTIFTEFQKDARLRVLIADAGCMAHGLTLTEANTIVWYAPEFSNDIYQQANGRITRPGQKNNQFIIHLEGTELERRLYKRLEQRGSTQGILLKLAAEGAL
jgi:SNF2 family DNA or RNA helicase